jgi:hypothetical protein
MNERKKSRSDDLTFVVLFVGGRAEGRDGIAQRILTSSSGRIRRSRRQVLTAQSNSMPQRNALRRSSPSPSLLTTNGSGSWAAYRPARSHRRAARHRRTS